MPGWSDGIVYLLILKGKTVINGFHSPTNLVIMEDGAITLQKKMYPTLHLMVPQMIILDLVSVYPGIGQLSEQKGMISGQILTREVPISFTKTLITGHRPLCLLLQMVQLVITLA